MRHSSRLRPGRVRLAAAATAGVLGTTAALLSAAPAQGDPGSTVLYVVAAEAGKGKGTLAAIDSATRTVTPLAEALFGDVTGLPGGDLLLFENNTAFRYDLVTGTLSEVGRAPIAVNALATGPDGEVFAAGRSDQGIYQVAVGATSVTFTQVGALPSGMRSSGDLLVLDSGVYASVLTADGSEDQLLRMDDTTGANPVLIGASGPLTFGLAQTSVGEFASQGSDLVRIDLTTGAKSDPTPVGLGEIFGLADPVTPQPEPVIPEVPVAALLPLAAVAVGAAMLGRRRTV